MPQTEMLTRKDLTQLVLGERGLPPESPEWFTSTTEAARKALERSNSALMAGLPVHDDYNFDLSELDWAKGRILPKARASHPRVLIHPPDFYATEVLFPERDPFDTGVPNREQQTIPYEDREPLTKVLMPADQTERFSFQVGPHTSLNNLELIARLIHAGLPTVNGETIAQRYIRDLYAIYKKKEGHPPYVLASARSTFVQHFGTPNLVRDSEGKPPTRHLTVNTLYLVEPSEGVPWVKALLGFNFSTDRTTRVEIERLRASKRVQPTIRDNVFTS